MALNTTIGGITVKINADISGFNAGLNKVSNRVSETGKKLRANANQYGKWAAAGTAAAGAVAAAMVRSQMQTIDALAKTADRLGLTTQALAGLQRSAELSGADVGTLNMALQRMTRRVSEAAQGTGEAQNALKELGLDAQYLSGLSPDEQFKQIADAMGGVAEQGDKVRLAMRLFDSEGVKLVNTLAMGSEGLAEQERIAEKLGVALNRVDAAKVEAANDAMLGAGQAIEGVVNRVAVQLSPIIEEAAKSFFDASVSANGFGDTVDSVIKGATRVVGVFADGLHGIRVVIKGLETGAAGFGYLFAETMRIMTVGMEQFVNVGINGINSVIDAANSLGAGLQRIEPFSFGAARAMEGFADKAKQAVMDTAGEWHNLAMQPLPSDQIEQWVATVQEKAQVAGEAVAGALGGGSGEEGGAKMSEAETKALDDRINAIRENLMTEQQLKAEAYLADLEAIKQKRETDLANKQYYDDLEKNLQQQHYDELVGIAQNAADKEAEIEKRKQQAKISAIAGAFGNMSALMNTESKKLFKIGKIAAIAEATVTGIAAAVENYRQGSKIGGPPVGAAFAAASLAATGAQIAQIKSTQYGSAQGGQSYSGGQVVNNIPQQEQVTRREVSLNFVGSGAPTNGQQIVELLNEAIGDGANATFLLGRG